MRTFLILLGGLLIVGVTVYLYFFLTQPTVTQTEMDQASGAVPAVIDRQVPQDFPGLSKEISGISGGRSGYFPKDEFSGGWDGADDFTNDWYGKHLRAMNEPSLIKESYANNEIYRFLWLRTFHHPIAVRIERSFNDTKLTFTELSGAGGYDPGTVLRHEKIFVDDNIWYDFLKQLDKARYWKLGKLEDDGGHDGAQWVMEGVRDGRYHLVDRWSPTDGDYRETCIFLLKLSGINLEKLGGDLY